MFKFAIVVLISYVINDVSSNKVKMEKIFYSYAEPEHFFDGYIKHFKKKYATKEEYRKRFEIFKTNLQHINEKNKESPITAFGINQFADHSEEDLKKYNRILNDHEWSELDIIDDIPTGNAPTELDYRKKGYDVTRLRNTKFCGNFAACAQSDLATGTSIRQKYDVFLERKDTCYADKTNSIDEAIKRKKKLKLFNEETLKDALTLLGPLSAVIDMSWDLMVYSGGIFNQIDCTSNRLISHDVLLIGYGTDGGVDYWIIYNSWGDTWGEKGYGRLERGKNICDITGSISTRE